MTNLCGLYGCSWTAIRTFCCSLMMSVLGDGLELHCRGQIFNTAVVLRRIDCQKLYAWLPTSIGRNMWLTGHRATDLSVRVSRWSTVATYWRAAGISTATARIVASASCGKVFCCQGSTQHRFYTALCAHHVGFLVLQGLLPVLVF